MANPTKENKPVKKGLISGLKRFFGGNVDVVENEILEDYKANGFLVDDFYSYGSNIAYLENRAQQYETLRSLWTRFYPLLN